jgi:hypothetical protein
MIGGWRLSPNSQSMSPRRLETSFFDCVSIPFCNQQMAAYALCWMGIHYGFLYTHLYFQNNKKVRQKMHFIYQYTPEKTQR